MRSKDNVLGRVAAGTRAFALASIALELFARGAGLANWDITEPHARLGRWRTPESRQIRFNEGFHVGRVNEYGYLGGAYPADRSADALRIALIGDSFVEAFQLFGRAHFGTLLEAEPALSSRRVEVLNFGMSGLNLEDMAVVQTVLVEAFSPDYTLFFVRDSDFSLRDETPERPFFRIDAAGLTIDSSFTESRQYRLASNPAVRLMGRSALLSLVRRGAEASRANLQRPRGDSTRGVGSRLEGGVRPRWDVVSGVLAKLASPTQGAANVVITWDTLQADAEAALAHHDLDRWRLDGALERLAATGRAPDWWPVSNRKGHWNSHAHRAIAAELATRIAQRSPEAR